MADQKMPVDIGKIKEKLQDAAGSLDDTALDSVAGGQQEAILTCIILCSGKEKEKQE